jgi:hypothetical protein
MSVSHVLTSETAATDSLVTPWPLGHMPRHSVIGSGHRLVSLRTHSRAGTLAEKVLGNSGPAWAINSPVSPSTYVRQARHLPLAPRDIAVFRLINYRATTPLHRSLSVAVSSTHESLLARPQ